MTKLSKGTLDDLKKSGLDSKTIKAMQIREINTHEFAKLFNSAFVPVYEIPYFDLKGNPNGFCRYKLLGEYKSPKRKSSPKYLQPVGTKPRFYFPPIINWAAIATNPEQEIYFTEGEKKAAALTLLGFPTIGLGGVWCWKSSEDDFSDPIADFNLIDWSNRKTIIVFDADV